MIEQDQREGRGQIRQQPKRADDLAGAGSCRTGVGRHDGGVVWFWPGGVMGRERPIPE